MPRAKELRAAEQRWRARLILGIVRPGLVLVFVFMLAFLVVGDQPAITIALHAGAACGLVGLWALVAAGQVRAASVGLLVVFWGIFLAACAYNGGIASVSMAGYITLIIGGGVLLGWQGVIAALVGGVVAGAVLATGESLGWIAPASPVSPWVRLVTWALYLAASGMFLIAALRSLTGARHPTTNLPRMLAYFEAEAVSYDYVDTLLTKLADAVIVVDDDDNIVDVNEATVDLLRFPRDELLRMRFSELPPTPSLTGEPEGTRARGVEVEWRTGDGGTVLVSTSIAWVEDARGRRSGMVCVAHDLTARARLQRDLERERQRAEEANRAKSDFLARMSHEIRTPMNAVIGMSDLLLESQLDVEQRELVETVRSSGEVLLNLVEEVLDFSRIEAGKLAIERVPFDPWDAVYGTVDLLSRTAHEKGLDLVIEVDPALPSMVVGDGGRLRQIVLNLLTNAVKYTETGSVTVAAQWQGDALEVSVTDTGPGIPAAVLPSLFEPFEQVHTDDQQRGAGLGLAIVGQLVGLMGGSVSVDSEVGTGSRFGLTIPMLAHGDSALPAVTGSALVVHAGPRAAAALASALRRFGIDARSGGVDDLTQVIDVDLVVLDTSVAADLLAVVTGVLARENRPRMVLLTEKGRSFRQRAQWRELGVDAVLSKPADPRRVAGVIGAGPHAAAILRNQGDRDEMQVLVAEDNPVNQTVTRRILESDGYDVIVAADGRVAIEVAHAGLALALVDLHMPILDGEAVIRDLRGRFPELPILALTAAATRADRQRCLDAGADAVLLKPIRAEVLRQAVRRHLQDGPLVEPPDPVTDEVPSIDMEMVRSLRQMGELALETQPRFLADVVKAFEDETARRLEMLATALSAGDSEGAARAAHAMKGGAGTVGASRLAMLAARVEDAARAGEVDYLLTAALRAEYERSAPRIRSVLLERRVSG